MGTLSREAQATLEFVRFVDKEATSIVQALRMAGENNDNHAREFVETYGMDADSAAVGLMKESAVRWRKIADEFDALFDKLPDVQDDDPYFPF
jgi:hypothetical protein